MFRISKKTEYGILAVQYICSTEADRAATVREIAEKHKISQTLLAKILQQLARENIIRSVQGPRGGYIMNGNAGKVSLADVFEAIEGPLHLTECDLDDQSCSRYEDCTLRDGFAPIQQQVAVFFRNVLVKDLPVDTTGQ
ncbi:MAG: Rrf2 family transcriptional regulator [Actinobacteria bacterium]|nr:Rrf2 family transcriptional regulator [Actinomycetota bacterium]